MLFSKKRSCSAWPRVPGSIHQTDSVSCKVGVQHSARVPVLVGREEPLHRASPGGTIAKTTRALDALRIIYIWKYTDDSQTSPLPLYAQLPSPPPRERASVPLRCISETIARSTFVQVAVRSVPLPSPATAGVQLSPQIGPHATPGAEDL